MPAPALRAGARPVSAPPLHRQPVPGALGYLGPGRGPRRTVAGGLAPAPPGERGCIAGDRGQGPDPD
ncbi:hypothetical protein DFQ29_005995 [Apophysomyces sp. BC1021]|nr:hypothetical protein DFQ29_005995 [Apophysomyces sp. BC1021]